MHSNMFISIYSPGVYLFICVYTYIYIYINKNTYSVVLLNSRHLLEYVFCVIL